MKKIFLLFVLLVLTSCINSSPESSNLLITEDRETVSLAYPTVIDYNESYPSSDSENPINANTPIPEVSDQGLSTIHGRIFLKNNSNLPLSNTLIYLTPGKGENQSPPKILIGPEPKEGDYATHSDDNAFFSFNNVAPGTYYLVVSSTNSYSLVEVEDEPIAIDVVGGQTINLGDQFVVLP